MSWNVIQSASGNYPGGTTFFPSATYTSNVSSGTKLLCFIAIMAPVTDILAVGDGVNGAGNQLTLISSYDGGGNWPTLAIYAMDTPAGDVGTKPAITGSLANRSDVSVLIQEVSGLAAGTTGITDGSAGSANGNPPSGSMGPPVYGSAVSNEYLVYAYADDEGQQASPVNAYTWTTPGGYTADSASLNTQGTVAAFINNLAVAYGNSTGGTESGSWAVTGSGGAHWSELLVAFQLPSAGGAAPAGAQPAAPGRTWQRRFKHRQTPAIPPAAQVVQANLTDSGTGSDALAIAANVPLTDAGTGSDALAVASAVPFTDSGTSAEVLGIMPGLTDSGTGTDALAITQPTSLTDAGQGIDSLAIVQPTSLADSGTSADALGIMPGLADTGQGTDALSITLASSIPLTDAGSAADTLGIMPGLTDSGMGTESLAITSAVTLGEAGQGADAFAVTQPTGLADAGHGADTLTIVPATFGAAPGSATAANGLAWSVYAQHSAPSVKAANRPAQLVTAGNSI